MIDIETNYFTIIEDHFRCARGTGMFMLSPRDVALIEKWKERGIPIEAVLRGIDAVFEKRRARSGLSRTQPVNSIAYCTQAIAEEAQAIANTSAPVTNRETKAPFPIEDVQSFFARNIEALRHAGQDEIAKSLESLDLDALFADLGQLEKRLLKLKRK